MPFTALVAWMPWRAANPAWAIFSLGCFAASIVALLTHIHANKWVAASICLFFSPTYVGVLNGNPSVLSISLTILCLHFASRERIWIAGLLFGISVCVKPHVALCSFLALLLWRRRRPLMAGVSLAAFISATAAAPAFFARQASIWWTSLQQNLAIERSPGGILDSRPSSPYAYQLLNAQTLSYLVSDNPLIADGLVVIFDAVLTAAYFYLSRKSRERNPWVDATFCAAITLSIAYHRYYDAQLLLVSIPAATYLWQSGRKGIAFSLGVGFALMAFPIQSVFEKVLGPVLSPYSLATIILQRTQPIVMLGLIVAIVVDQLRLITWPGQTRPVDSVCTFGR